MKITEEIVKEKMPFIWHKICFFPPYKRVFSNSSLKKENNPMVSYIRRFFRKNTLPLWLLFLLSASLSLIACGAAGTGGSDAIGDPNAALTGGGLLLGGAGSNPIGLPLDPGGDFDAGDPNNLALGIHLILTNNGCKDSALTLCSNVCNWIDFFPYLLPANDPNKKSAQDLQNQCTFFDCRNPAAGSTFLDFAVQPYTGQCNVSAQNSPAVRCEINTGLIPACIAPVVP